jgi:enterochelin esterase-like enzyme
MTRTSRGVARLFLLAAPLVVSRAIAQSQPQPSSSRAPIAQPSPADIVVSPDVRSDGRVTFRIYAPNATTLSVRGDWGQTRRFEVADLVKGATGIWSVTLGPLAPSLVRYTFLVNGVTVVDQRNKTVIAGNGAVQSVVLIPGPGADFMAAQPVAHGAVRTVWYQSSSLGIARRMHIYTPPGYDLSRDPLPVLYLLPGASSDDEQWSAVGRAGFILDNLLAAAKTKAMVVVMPNPIVPGQPEDILPVAPSEDKFTDDLLKDVMPYVKTNLRVRADPESTALAGLSTGGGRSLLIGLNNLDRFSQLGLFSSGWFPKDLAEVERRHQRLLDDAETKERLKLLWIGVGTGDLSAAYPNTPYLLQMLQRHGIKYMYRETDGDHTWLNWRRYLAEFAPLLFR